MPPPSKRVRRARNLPRANGKFAKLNKVIETTAIPEQLLREIDQASSETTAIGIDEGVPREVSDFVDLITVTVEKPESVLTDISNTSNTVKEKTSSGLSQLIAWNKGLEHTKLHYAENPDSSKRRRDTKREDLKSNHRITDFFVSKKVDHR